MEKLEIEGNYLNLIKDIQEKPMANIIQVTLYLLSITPNTLHLKSLKHMDVLPLLTIFIQH